MKHSKFTYLSISFGFLFIFSLIAIGVVLSRNGTKHTEIHDLVSLYLQHASREEVDGVYALTSAGYKRSVSKADTKLFIARRDLFQGFQDQLEESVIPRVVAGKPTEYEYIGTIRYTDGVKGTVTATIIKEDWEYKILNIKVHKDLPR